MGIVSLDIIALVGTLRYVRHTVFQKSIVALCKRGVVIAERTVTNLLARYEELVALRLTEQARLHERLIAQGHVILALDTLAGMLLSSKSGREDVFSSAMPKREERRKRGRLCRRTHS